MWGHFENFVCVSRESLVLFPCWEGRFLLPFVSKLGEGGLQEGLTFIDGSSVDRVLEGGGRDGEFL